MTSPLLPARLGRATRAASISDETVGIVGAGAFATALASVISARGVTAILYSEDPSIVRDINVNRRNEGRLPGVSLARRVAATSDPTEMAALARVVILAVSSRSVVKMVRELGQVLDERHVVAHAIGALAGDDRRVSQIVRDHTRVERVVALAGPALPGDLTARRSCGIVAASDSAEALEEVKRVLHAPPVLRLYKSTDLVGVELAAAVSGALTVGVGLADGLEIGHGPRTLFITRAATEGARLCHGSGADPRTFFGLSGLGNLLARSAPESRADSVDYQLGVALARGLPPPRGETEGVRTLATAVRVADLLGMSAPIVRTVHDVVCGRISAEVAADRLANVEADLE